MARMKILSGLLTFVAFGMLIGALFQLAVIQRLEGSPTSPIQPTSCTCQLHCMTHGTKFLSLLRMHEIQHNGYLRFPRGITHWVDDKEAVILRLGMVKPEVLSWSPRIMLFRNFLSTEECDYLRAIAHPHLRTSAVVDRETGKGINSDARTSTGMFLDPEERKNPIIQAIERRIAVYSQVPEENGEDIQVLRYEKSQFYLPHHDFFIDSFSLEDGGQRIATMLMYLSDDVEGGETHFPKAGSGKCTCGGKTVKGLCIKPVKGDAVLFWSMGLDGNIDMDSQHGGCEVLKGEKWSATKWMTERAFS